MSRLPQSPALISAGGLIVGYAVAVITTRTIGGFVLLIAGAAAFALWTKSAGLRTGLQLLAVYVGLFVVSHLLGLIVGAWASVALVALIMAAASWWLADSRSDDPAPVS
jgi:hypothetical protein